MHCVLLTFVCTVVTCLHPLPSLNFLLALYCMFVYLDLTYLATLCTRIKFILSLLSNVTNQIVNIVIPCFGAGDPINASSLPFLVSICCVLKTKSHVSLTHMDSGFW